MSARNLLQNLSQDFGWGHDALSETPLTSVPPHRVRVSFRLPGLVTEEAEGTGQRQRDAAARAWDELLDRIRGTHPELFEDAPRRRADAQLGDVLLKLAVHMAHEHDEAATRSDLLQAVEKNRDLAPLFDRWREAGDEALAVYGPGLGRDGKATLVEALIWRRHRHLIGADLRVALGLLYRAVGGS